MDTNSHGTQRPAGAQGPVKKTAQKPAQQPARKAVQKSAQKPVQKAAPQKAAQSAQRKQGTARPAAQTGRVSAGASQKATPRSAQQTGRIKIPAYSTQSFKPIEHLTMRKAPASYGGSAHVTQSFSRPQGHAGTAQQRTARTRTAGASATGTTPRTHAGATQQARRVSMAASAGSRAQASASARTAGAPHAAGTARTRTAVRPAAPARRRTPARSFSPRSILIALVAAVVVVGGAVLGIGYQFFWRNVDVMVNGRAYATPISSNVQELLVANDYFGVKPGRMLSVGGNVLDEQGGDRCAVTSDGAPLAADQFETTKAVDTIDLTVANGADVTEPATEETVDLMPGIQTEGTGAIQFVSQWGKKGKKTVLTGEKSGETVDKEVVEAPVDMVVSYLNCKPKGSKKYIALTFDDGPSSYTQDILDILQRYGVKATFFNLGTQVNSKSQAVLDAGCELASHTNAHQNLPECDRDTLRSEISTAFDALEGATGERPQMIRAPYGAFTATEWARSGDLISCNVLWNIDTLDWKLPGSGAITSEVLSNAYNGAIALMHDGGGNRSQDVEALPGIIEGLQADGYELVTVSELMELDGRFPEDVVNGTVKMPEDAVLPEV